MAYGLLEQEQKDLILTVGSHRLERRLGPIVVARLFKKMMNNGASLHDCAEMAHLDGPSMVSRFLRLLNLSDEIEIAVDWGASGLTVGFTSAFEIARLPAGEQSEVCKAAIEYGLTSGEVRQLVQYRRRSIKPLKECVAQIVQLRPRVERRYMHIGRIDDELVLKRLKLLTVDEGNLVLRRVLSR